MATRVSRRSAGREQARPVARNDRGAGLGEETRPVGDAAADLTLVRSVLRRDPDAVAAFVERMHCVPRIVAALNARTGRPLDEHDLADLVQDVLVVVWRKLEGYAAEAALEFWVYRICYFELMNGIRRKRRRPRPASPLPEDELHDPGSDAEPALESEPLLRALEELAWPAADVIRLKHFEELTFEAIGGRLGVSPNTVKAWYYRGLTKLAALLRARAARERRR